MNDVQHKTAIAEALNGFTAGPLAENARHLLRVLGYESNRTLHIKPNTAEGFLARWQINPEKALLAEWDTCDFLFQLTEEDIAGGESAGLDFAAHAEVDAAIYRSYLFLTVKLKGRSYSLTALANITRAINNVFAMPAMLLFQHGQALTFSIIHRRPSRREGQRDVLEKVSLIKDIDVVTPHRAHVEILSDLSLSELHRAHGFTNFLELHQAWQKTLDSSALNKRFFRELAEWYFWAVDNVTFPADAGEDVSVHNATCVIRLITRLIFVWFLKEKGLIPDALFDETEIARLLRTSTETDDSCYYKAILQNLFFATLNQEMNTPAQPNRRAFHDTQTREAKPHQSAAETPALYQYKHSFREPDAALRLFETIPFLNGGLFECLGTIDGFSDRDDNPLHVPNELFFAEEHEVELNAVYGTKNKRYTVRGLIHILNRYKFTIAENTPIEEEVALDPELLGRVFENLLAAYNPETRTTARKQTGSFYTPREIVNYMVDASLLAYFTGALIRNNSEGRTDLDAALRHLLAYTDEPHQFTPAETEQLITAIDTLNILDPTCGSGAFPMGILQKLVFLLGKLDPGNAQWRQRQLARVRSTIAAAEQIDDSTFRESTIDELERELASINEAFERNELDYGRKLYLIENCIYGVDIQPIATQIAKLRFFISLIVDQRIDDTQPNRGVRPLPNLETKFVAANTLLGIEGQLSLRSPDISEKERQLAAVRRRHFTARTPRTKARYRHQDALLRTEISALLHDLGLPSGTAQELAAWDPYNQNASAAFFDAEWMFGISEGFDVVTGNPPYIQLQKSGGALGRLYQNADFETFARTGDIYCLFYERGIRLLASDGHLCYITSNKWMRAGYGKALRRFFAENIQPIKLLDLGPDIFDATVDTNILLCSRASTVPVARGPVPREAIACTVTEKYKHTATSLAAYAEENGVRFPLPEPGAQWAILSDIERQIQAKIEAVGTPLKEWDISIYRGIVTGYNTAFLIDNQTKEGLVSADPKSAEIIKPILRGKDIGRYQANWKSEWLIATFPALDMDINTYPAVKEWLANFLPKLNQTGSPILRADQQRLKARLDRLNIAYNERDFGKLRKKTSHQWFELQDISAYHTEFEKPKIVYPETTHAANFFYDEGKHFIEKTCFTITGSDLKILVGLLSSTLLTFAYKRFYCGTVLGKKGYQYNKHSLETLPVVQIPADEQPAFIALVDEILAAKKANPGADTSDLEKEVDTFVYGLYHLTPEDIGIVDG
ncbi:hypothetical protein C6495_09990 [Candidatus Poribacteria bacterium]|nr:MAG: hypothetical protein C6495_09990 [Candidatus Poribacteria bacterium]